MIDADIILYALMGGILPALVWLLFWLREDYRHPEPRKLLLKTFLLGMAAVVVVLPFQKAIDTAFPGVVFITMLMWVVLEEVFKFGGAYLGGIKSVDDNEPVDPIVYMITAALGFAALENTLFILDPLIEKEVMHSVVAGNLRFIGASLLHIVSSGIVGVSLALSFYKPRKKKFTYVLVGLTIAVAFHASFNLLILHLGNLGALLGFGLVWIGVVWLLLAFEKAKTIAR